MRFAFHPSIGRSIRCLEGSWLSSFVLDLGGGSRLSWISVFRESSHRSFDMVQVALSRGELHVFACVCIFAFARRIRIILHFACHSRALRVHVTLALSFACHARMSPVRICVSRLYSASARCSRLGAFLHARFVLPHILCAVRTRGYVPRLIYSLSRQTTLRELDLLVS